jgi:hypothetical protein
VSYHQNSEDNTQVVYQVVETTLSYISVIRRLGMSLINHAHRIRYYYLQYLQISVMLQHDPNFLRYLQLRRILNHLTQAEQRSFTPKNNRIAKPEDAVKYLSIRFCLGIWATTIPVQRRTNRGLRVLSKLFHINFVVLKIRFPFTSFPIWFSLTFLQFHAM